ncbi:hypothetical protein [Rubellicoccus peritrichatus]|uniref:Uncharacterized protein n=1 Tax=Rubellicoccus peritrichatus TaxID=3080537 RepID=A0AAQ3QUB0_9BACT|nr:hypothetical protein [Puniceicoccus sp. CR14]WOO39780.1 hypothetical protein RZN69_14240 [Puniceicoccus sp. CR14]
MNRLIGITILSAFLAQGLAALPVPDQDAGLPYTRSGYATAVGQISDTIAVLPGSRYAYVEGHRVRLDPAQLRSGEAIAEKNDVWVPAAFAAVVLADSRKADVAPDYLSDRYVHALELSSVKIPSGIKSHKIDGNDFVSLTQLADKAGLKITRGDGGLMLLSKKPVDYAKWTQPERDAVTVLFDTPEKFANPDLATQYIPQLKRQGPWTDLVSSVTEDELALLEGPEPDWPVTPRSEYNFDGFNFAMLGSAVPEPGAYPRLLFSEEDLPAIRERVKNNKIAQKTLIEIEVLLERSWLNPETDDGRVFEKLVAGNVEGLTWDPWKGGRRIPLFPGTFEGMKRGIYSSHVAYNSQCLVSMALYALVKGDDALGRKAAQALVALYSMQEPVLDKYLEFSDSELGSNPADANGSTTQWRGMTGVIAHMDLPFALDFGGKWMTEKEKETMIRIIVKATYGRRNNGGDGPRRNWRDINHMTWHMTHFLSLAAIEGLEGFDAAAYESGAELVGDFVQWGVDADGTMYESNGKSGGGIIFQTLSMNVLARRGWNLWGHPHWRNLMKAEALNTAPNGALAVSSGTWSGGLIATPLSMMYHAFYPENRYAEFLLSSDFGESNTTFSLSGQDIKELDLDAYRKQLTEKPGRTRLPGPNTPAFTMTLIYDIDWQHTQRKDLVDAPLDFVDDEYGVLSSFSENDREATWMQMQVRSNHYLGAGHHHADAGMFHFSSDAVNWITESAFQKCYEGRFHNQVLIDGISQPDDIQARADWLGSYVSEDVALASADLTQSYSWVWKNQFIYYDTDEWGPRPDQFEWTLSKDPHAIAAFKGTQRYKMRPWWPTGIFANWTPVLQRPFNPVQYVYRTAGLVRGEHSYGLVIDDAKKDDEVRLYQWSAMPGPGVWAASGYKDLPKNMLVVAQNGKERFHAGARRFRPKQGDPLLLICLFGGQGVPAAFEDGPSNASKFALDPYSAKTDEKKAGFISPIRIETRADGPHWRSSDQVQFFYDQIIGGCHADEAHFRTLLIPFRHGEELPEFDWNEEKMTLAINWPNQKDVLTFTEGDHGQTYVEISRNGEKIFSGMSVK